MCSQISTQVHQWISTQAHPLISTLVDQLQTVSPPGNKVTNPAMSRTRVTIKVVMLTNETKCPNHKGRIREDKTWTHVGITISSRILVATISTKTSSTNKGRTTDSNSSGRLNLKTQVKVSPSLRHRLTWVATRFLLIKRWRSPSLNLVNLSSPMERDKSESKRKQEQQLRRSRRVTLVLSLSCHMSFTGKHYISAFEFVSVFL